MYYADNCVSTKLMIKILLYSNSMCSLSVLTKMTSFKETKEFILLSYKTGLINVNDVLLSYLSYISLSLDLPFRNW